MDELKYQIFLEITTRLNAFGIYPVLMGSLGFERCTGYSWNPRDIDIHVPGDIRGWDAPDNERIDDWNTIKAIMTTIGFKLYDLHEHAFTKDGIDVEFGVSTTLPEFAGVKLEELSKIIDSNATYYLPSKKQFLLVYKASSKDSYRNDKNNNKDLAKIEYLTKNP